jgi:hypothetical protein
MVVRVSFPGGLGVKQPVHKDDQLPPSSAVIKNEWSYWHTSSPPACLHGMNRDNFTIVNIHIKKNPPEVTEHVIISPACCNNI